MITNLPKAQDFEQVTIQCLTQAFNLLFKVYQNFTDYDEDIQEDIELLELWSHNDGTIRTSIILLHQAVETIMKSEVCKTSPLLLIEKNRTDWPTLPSKQDKDFDDLYTIAGESLLSTFCAVESKIEIDNNLINFIEKIRKNRNKAIHGASKIDISPEDLLDDILTAFTSFFGKDKWFKHLSNFNLTNPLFGYFSWEYENTMAYEFLDFAEFMLGRKRLNKHISIDITAREYYCPECKNIIEGEVGDMDSKWTFLSPNEPKSNNVYCVNCSKNYEVSRINCTTESCKGNVISTDEEVGYTFCLTCFEQQEE